MAPGFGQQPGGLESSLFVPWRDKRAAAWTAASSRRPPTMPKVANWLIRLLEDSKQSERACTSVRGSGAFRPGSLIRRVLPLWAVLNLES